MFKCLHVAIGVTLFSCGSLFAQGALKNVKLEGYLYFKHHVSTGIRANIPTAPGSPVAPPGGWHHSMADVVVELVAFDSLGNAVSLEKVKTDKTGSYQFNVKTDYASDHQIRVWYQTAEGGAKQFGNLRVMMGDINNHQYRVLSNKFNLLPLTKSSVNIDLLVGLDGDGDTNIGAIVADEGVFRAWTPVVPFLGHQTENDMGKMAGLFRVLETIYLEVEKSNKISWFGELEGWDTHGFRIQTPGGALGNTAKAVSWPNTVFLVGEGMTTYLAGADLFGGANPSYWVASTMAHEFAHQIHYHTTALNVGDFFNEFLNGGHFFHQDSYALFGLLPGNKVAYAEGWAEFCEAVFVDTHPALLFQDWIVDAVGRKQHPYVAADPEGFAWKGDDPRLNPSPDKSDGTNNSGETVEGAVAQVMWANRNKGAGSFVDTIEPIWEIVRNGAKKESRNDIKVFHSSNPGSNFYDLFMSKNSGNGKRSVRQDMRDACNERGIVYSRMKHSQYRQVKDEGPLEQIQDRAWVSAESQFRFREMTASDLNVTSAEHDVHEIKMTYLKKGMDHPRDKPYDLTKVPEEVDEQDLVNLSLWKELGTSSSGQFFIVDVDANAKSLKNQYHFFRAEIQKDQIPGVANTETIDKLNGPILGPPVGGVPIDRSGKLSAEWWKGQRIILEVKVDKVRPRITIKGPAPNP